MESGASIPEEACCVSAPRHVTSHASVVRIAIGKKVFSNRCLFQYKRNHKQGHLVLSYVHTDGTTMYHNINLDDSSLQEIRYHISSDGSSGMPITLDFDESKYMSFLAMQIEPNDQNELSKYTNAYQPSAGNAKKRYISVEFRLDSDLRDLLTTLKTDVTLGAFVDGSSMVTFDDIEMYGGSLLDSARQERIARERSLAAPRRRRTSSKTLLAPHASKDFKVVFPFGADADKIDGAAIGFDVALQHIALTKSISKCESDRMVDYQDREAVRLANGSISCKEECLASGKKNSAHYLTIEAPDYDRLVVSTEFLNDCIVDFWFQWYVIC